MTTFPAIPGWLRGIGIATIVAMIPLVVLGGQTTTRVAGMADPVWPTEPWYLVINGHVFAQEPQPGFLLEHTHRAAGWITGLLATVFTLGLWAIDKRQRAMGLGLVLFLFVAYGTFHTAMRQIKDTPDSFGSYQAVTGILSILAALACLGLAVNGILKNMPHAWARFFATAGLIGVMIQGLLGGFRVLLNAKFGPDLAIVHGCFAHVVVSLYIAAVTLIKPTSLILNPLQRSQIQNWVIAAMGVVLLQLVWGALTRHAGTAFAQRMHLLTAFVATATVLGVVAVILFQFKPIFSGFAAMLLVVVFLQVGLGVEAYLGKFASVGPEAHKPPQMRIITDAQAITRTMHVFIGLVLLGTLVSLLVNVCRRVPILVKSEAVPEPATVPQPLRTAVAS